MNGDSSEYLAISNQFNFSGEHDEHIETYKMNDLDRHNETMVGHMST